MIREFWAILDGRQRRQFAFLVTLVIVSAVFEFFGLSAVFALALHILAPKDSVGPARLMSGLFGGEALRSPKALPWLAGVVVVAFLLRSCLGIFANWLRADVIIQQREILRERLLRNFLRMEWQSFSGANVSLMTGKIVSSCEQLTTDLLNQAAICLTELCVLLALGAGLAFVSPVAVIVMGLFALVFVVGLHKALRRWMYHFGDISWNARQDANRTVETALRGGREVMLYDLRDVFLERLRASARPERTAGALAMTFHDSPRQVIEFFAVALFFGFIGGEAALGHSLQAIGVIASVFIAAAFRILPSISRLAMGAVRMSNLKPVFEALREDLAIPPPESAREGPVARLPFARTIELGDVGFRYRGSGEDALTGISVSIPRGAIVGVVGRSGAGKTTLMEILLGVLEPTQGELRIDGVRLDAASRAAWQAGVGYVPQEPYLCDDTIAANIAFGIPPDQVDMDEVRRAARLAGVADFIETQTSTGYHTPVGDGGAALSGGQRQRLVIARALYRRPQLLVFDEATSALDNVTETAVHEAISALGGETTVLVVAHRFTSVRHCREILVLEQGRLVQQGGYDDLAREPGAFRELLEGRLAPRAAAE